VLQRLPRPRLWGVALLGCISILPVLLAPIITGVLVDFGGFTDRAAGLRIRGDGPRSCQFPFPSPSMFRRWALNTPCAINTVLSAT
jgi:hypothetical protein